MMRALSLFSAGSLALAAMSLHPRYPEMTQIPGGDFQMGDHAGFVDPQHPSDEVPIHQVTLTSFYIGTYHVTNSQYLEFLNSALSSGAIEVRNGFVYRKGTSDLYCDTRLSADWSSIGWDGKVFTLMDNRGDHPVVGIRWLGAAAYTNWLSSQLNLQSCYDPATWKCDFLKNGYRLPTEAEWEYAARGGQHRPYYNYPWGNNADPAKANWPLTPSNPFQSGPYPWTTPVGFFNGTLHNRSDFGWPAATTAYQTGDGANAYGLYDMAGNVWQVIHDWYETNYYSSSPAKNPTGPDAGSKMPDGLTYHGMRGGNWYNGDLTDPGHARVSNRNPIYFRGPQDPNHPYYHIGFRVARSVTGASPAPTTMTRLAGTGQTVRYTSTFGQDADYKLNSPSFVINADGTVTDMITGLMWQQTDSGEMVWEDAVSYCKTLTLAAHSDWRLPFAHELYSILNQSYVNPALDTSIFAKSTAEYWWSVDQRSDDPTRIWVTNAGGGIGPHPKSETISAGGGKRMQARCVRSSVAVNSLRCSFVDNGDGTITDNHTGLMWQKADSGAAVSWEDALQYSERLSFAGYDDWRLPNIKELQSLNDETLVNPSLDQTYFGGSLPAENWSSTTLANQTGQAWTVDFTYGIASYRAKTDLLRVRSVRGGFAGLAVSSAASFGLNAAVAPDSIASAFSTTTLPADATIALVDGHGVSFKVEVLAIAAGQANLLIPAGASTGIGSLSISSGGREAAAGVVRLDRVAPGLFSANADGQGVAAGIALIVEADGRQTTQLLFDDTAPAGSRRSVAVDVSRAGTQIYLSLFGTGMRNVSEKSTAIVGGTFVPVTGPVAQGEYQGLDQVNIGPIPGSLARRGEVDIILTVDETTANKVTVNFK